jgi:uncharacterized protein HemX
MPRLPTLLIAAALAIGFGGVQLAQSQTEAPPPAGQTAPAVKGKKALTPEEKAERKAKRQAMTPEEKAKLKQERAAKKEAKAAKKAKRQDCLAKGKQDNLKGKQFREFMQTCTAG